MRSSSRIGSALLSIVPMFALANEDDPFGKSYVTVQGIFAGANPVNEVQVLIGNILKYLMVLGVVMVIVGGFYILTAAGSDDRIGNGRKIIARSLIGIVIIFIAYALVNLVFQILAGS